MGTRRFAAMALTISIADGAKSAQKGVRMTTLITPEYLLPYTPPPEVNDYRCVVNAAGIQVIFERAPYDPTTKKSGSFRLYLYTLGGEPAPLFQNPIARATNRPD
jgi:hypothetical protein